MGKSTRLQGELIDVTALLEIIQVLKDVSQNRFFVFAQRKSNYQRFFEVFMRYFEMLGDVETSCPLVKNNNPGVDILSITSEQGFMSQLNGRVGSATFAEYNKYPGARLICIGVRGAEKCKGLGMNVEKIFPSGGIDRFDLAVQIRDFLIERIMSGKTGKAVIVYLWAKSFSVLKPRVVTLLPASELLGQAVEGEDTKTEAPAPDDQPQAEEAEKDDKKKYFIQETNLDSIVMALADIWVHARIFEVVNDLQIVESAAQAQQLESAIEGLGDEKKSLNVSFKKAGREELNSAMREVFTSTSMMKNKARRK